MKCNKCDREAKGKTELCDPCRLKKWRKDSPKKVIAYAKFRYKRDKVKILHSLKKRNQKNGYAYDKKPKRMRDQLVRAHTRNKYPLKGNDCLFCDIPAEHRHHITEPIEIDKFIFLCKNHHKEIEDQKRSDALVSGEEQ